MALFRIQFEIHLESNCFEKCLLVSVNRYDITSHGMLFIFYCVHGVRRVCVSRYIRLARNLTAGKLRTDVARTPAVVARERATLM